MPAPDQEGLFEPTTAAALTEKRKLRKHFGRFDMLVFLLCTLVGLDTLGSVARHGAQGFTWLAFLGVVFFIPYALLTAELGSTFPQEGGPYVWVKLAFGRFAAAIGSVLYWASNPIWLGGSLTITAVATFGEFFTPLHQAGKYVFALAFIWFAVLAAVLSFSIGRWVPTIGAWVRVVVLGFFTLSVVIYAVSHGVHGVAAHDFRPTWAVFIATVPLLFFNYIGFELPSAAGDEMKDPQRDVPFAVIRAMFGTLVLYGLPILSILLVLPTSQVTSLGGFIDAMKTVFAVYGGHVDTASSGEVSATLSGAGRVLGNVAAIAFILALLSSGTTWIMGADRAQAVAGYDGAAPRFFGHFSPRSGTPVAVNLLTGVISTIVMVVAFQLTGTADKYFTASLGLAISTTTISYLLVFPTLIRLRYSHGDAARPFRVPAGNVGAWIVSVLCTGWAAVATASLLYPGFGTSHPDASLPDGWAGRRGTYELTQIVPLAVLIVLALLFYAAGTPTRRRAAETPVPEMAAAPSSPGPGDRAPPAARRPSTRRS